MLGPVAPMDVDARRAVEQFRDVLRAGIADRSGIEHGNRHGGVIPHLRGAGSADHDHVFRQGGLRLGTFGGEDKAQHADAQRA